MAAQNMPAAEVDVTVDLVRALLLEQHPDLADLQLSELANGWDNAIFRLGSDYTVRVPRRAAAAELVVNEARWLAGLAQRLPIPIPEPVRIGRPTASYPWHWNVCPWFEGEVASECPLSDPNREARRLGEFLATLHVPMPQGGPINKWRGGPIGELGARVLGNVAKLGAEIDAAAVTARWAELSAAAEWDHPAVFLHGDLHTANMLVHEGQISAIIDFGDVTTGDPAVDFAVAWMLFDPEARVELRQAAGGPDDALWSRAEAWALHFAIVYKLHSADNPRFDRMANNLLSAILL
jgi:aminoglycoside phosphotransferase (APT) family kinase protein